MKSVHVKAANLKIGDVLNGSRIKHIEVYARKNRTLSRDKDAYKEVLVLVPSRHGYRLDAIHIPGHTKVVVKRPIYNMKYRRV